MFVHFTSFFVLVYSLRLYLFSFKKKKKNMDFLPLVVMSVFTVLAVFYYCNIQSPYKAQLEVD